MKKSFITSKPELPYLFSSSASLSLVEAPNSAYPWLDLSFLYSVASHLGLHYQLTFYFWISWIKCVIYSGTDPGFLERGVHMYKGVGFTLLILSNIS